MPSLDQNMSLELANVLLSLSGVILLGLIGIIWYGLQQFTRSVKKLDDTVADMKVLISIIQERVTTIKSDISKSDYSIEERLKVITTEISRLDCEVADLKQELQILKVLEKEHHKK